MLLGISLILISSLAHAKSKKLVIAHRGASGYVVEHTLEAKTAAAVMGADFLEQDLLLTRDDKVVVFHDNYLDSSTEVGLKFPGRAREDGKNYVIDFDLDELRQLRLLEKFKNNDPTDLVYPARFPANTGNFRIHTLVEELDLIQGLEKTLGRSIGIYPELKSPWFHQKNGKCLWCAVKPILRKYGYLDRAIEKIMLQSFEVDTLEKVHAEYPKLKLIQLLAYNDWNQTRVLERDPLSGEDTWINYDYSWMYQDGGMERISRYAYGVGPWYPILVNENSNSDNWTRRRLLPTNLVAEARKNGLKIHAYTFRKEDVPVYAKDFDDFLSIFLNDFGIDGVFTDFPDLVVDFLRKNPAEQSNGASICGLSGLLMLAIIMFGQLLATEH